jgi:Ca-activated chloride channel family protein
MAMTFFWGSMLWLLLLVPALVAAYLLAQRRRQKYALRYASLSLVKEAIGAGPGIRRHVPPALFLAAMSVLVVALARPAAIVLLPSQQGTIILTLDNSGSMRADDVQPSRLEAAKAAARSFVEKQPKSSKIGVVSFAGSASLVQPPTREREAVLAAIDRLMLQRGTAIGSGILTSLNALLEELGEEPIGWQVDPFGPPAAAPESEATPLPAIIVLLSDGQSNTGPPPLEVVDQAARRGVRIYTVGLGSPDGTVISFYNRSFRVRLDEETLKSIAEKTDGAYYKADTGADLREIYEELATRLVFRPEKTEITALFAALAALLLLAAGGLSLLWFNRLP